MMVPSVKQTYANSTAARWKDRCVGYKRGEKTDLFVDRITLSENEVAAKHPREKVIVWPLLPTVKPPLKEQEYLIDRDKLGEIHRVLLRRAENDFESRRPAKGRTISASM